MNPALPVLSGRQMVRVLERAGFVPVGRRGSHVKLRSAEGRTVIVPLHPELARGTLASILRQAGMSVDDLLGSLG